MYFFGGKHIENEVFDDEWKGEVERRVQEIVNEGDLNGKEDTQYLNRDIMEEETEAALQGLQKGKAPGVILSTQTYC